MEPLNLRRDSHDLDAFAAVHVALDETAVHGSRDDETFVGGIERHGRHRAGGRHRIYLAFHVNLGTVVR